MAAPIRPRYTKDERSKRDRILNVVEGMFNDQSTFMAYWSDLARMVKPTRERFLTGKRNQGTRQNQQIINSTATFALGTLKAGMQSGLTSPARPWFKLVIGDEAIEEDPSVREWLQECADRMAIVFLRSNLYNALPMVYGDLGTFGTAAVGVFEDDEEVFRCHVFPIGSYAVNVDARGRLLRFARRYTMTVEMLVEEFGGEGGRPLTPTERVIDWSNFSDLVRTAWEAGNYTQNVEVVWYTARNRDDYDESALDGRQWPWVSCYVEASRDSHTDGFLRESGFRTCAVMAPRWEATGEDSYGTDCPAMTALGDIRQLQSQERTKGKAIQKMVDPPLQAPYDVQTQKVSLIPGDVTYADLNNPHAGIRPIHEVNYPVGELREDMAGVESRINEAFHKNLFLMLAMDDRGSQPITAEEVKERREEKLVQLAPVLERTNDELLDPLIDRAFDLMLHAGMFSEPPDVVKNRNIGVEYISLMAQAMKLVGIVAVDRFLQSVSAMAQIWPDARFKIKPFAVVEKYRDLLGVDPDLVADDDEAGAASNAEQQARARAQQTMLAAEQAKTAQALGNTPVEDNSALSRVLAGA